MFLNVTDKSLIVVTCFVVYVMSGVCEVVDVNIKLSMLKQQLLLQSRACQLSMLFAKCFYTWFRWFGYDYSCSLLQSYNNVISYGLTVKSTLDLNIENTIEIFQF